MSEELKIEVSQPRIAFDAGGDELTLQTSTPRIVFGENPTVPVFNVAQPAITFGMQGVPAPIPNIPAILAGENISALRCIRGDSDGKAYVCSNLDAYTMIGVTLTAASADSLISFRTNGLIEDSSWNWAENLPIYCGADGVLTQTQPTTGYAVYAGVPVSPRKMIVNIGNVIKLI
ncbi:MAG TPA: hypothetical protein DET40_21670 [Lentisphaeria bacterium]|nr:MAG: hypothetical protein A2X45_21760 [Lentisphaerae bacterium GWF2_50_93]HCE43893.1 hypothetical protein [Lentisphaeria bacterium]HCE46162.1 hypothetical protein [Lentisphaeria bacterium]